MPVVPHGFPSGLTDAQLDEAIAKIEANVAGWASATFVLQELEVMLLRAGLDERSRRENERVARSSLWAARVGIAIGASGVLVALAALLITFLR